MKSLNINLEGVDFNTVVDELNISLATLKNWIKAEYLIPLSDGQVTLDSFNNLKKNIIGKEKLTKRANKLYFDDTNTKSIKNKFLLQSQNMSSLEYENSLGRSYRNLHGIYYTPKHVINKMFEGIKVDINNKTFLDPCCGTGNFLLKALDLGFHPDNIYGFDLDKTAIKIAQDRIHSKYGFKLKNIKNSNFLDNFIHSSSVDTYDYIFTNPPWGSKYNRIEKGRYAEKLNNGIKADSSSFFTLGCIGSLNNNGVVGMLLPDSFFNISSFKSIREKVLTLNCVEFIDHGRPFEGLLTKAFSFVANKRQIEGGVKCLGKKFNFKRKQKDFLLTPDLIINFSVSQDEANTIRHLYSYKHKTLKNNATWALGIVTGNNAKFVLDYKFKDSIPVYKGKDVLNGGFKKPTNYAYKNLGLYQQVAKESFYKSKSKLIYKFISSNLVFALDLKPDEKKIGVNNKQLEFLLNSKVINWIFNKTFNTHKVLRRNLEELPIFVDFFKENNLHYNDQILNSYLNIEESDGTFRVKK